jgi:hypothetical protein
MSIIYHDYMQLTQEQRMRPPPRPPLSSRAAASGQRRGVRGGGLGWRRPGGRFRTRRCRREPARATCMRQLLQLWQGHCGSSGPCATSWQAVVVGAAERALPNGRLRWALSGGVPLRPAAAAAALRAVKGWQREPFRLRLTAATDGPRSGLQRRPWMGRRRRGRRLLWSGDMEYIRSPAPLPTPAVPGTSAAVPNREWYSSGPTSKQRDWSCVQVAAFRRWQGLELQLSAGTF